MADKKVRNAASVVPLTPTQVAQGPAMLSANKLAMSKPLGAAFLNHQVEQLEKTVSAKEHRGWRDRKFNGPQAPNNRRPAPGAGGGPKVARRGDEVSGPDERRKREGTAADKDADIVVVDASVLVHGISQVKKWCREGRPEVVIVPLEGVYALTSTEPLTQLADSP